MRIGSILTLPSLTYLVFPMITRYDKEDRVSRLRLDPSCHLDILDCTREYKLESR